MADNSQGTAGQQNPLDVLEDILNDAKKKSGGGDPDEAKKKAEEEEAQKLAEVEAAEQQQRAKDAQALKQQIAGLSAIKETPQYQARLEQDAEKQEQQQQDQADGEGFEIRQLGHTKI